MDRVYLLMEDNIPMGAFASLEGACYEKEALEADANANGCPKYKVFQLPITRLSTPKQHVIACARHLVDGYVFKFTNILDDLDRCIPQKNRVDMHQLQRALMSLEEEE